MAVERPDLIGTSLDYKGGPAVEKAFEITDLCGPGFAEGNNSRATLSYGHRSADQIVRVMYEVSDHQMRSLLRTKAIWSGDPQVSFDIQLYSGFFNISPDFLVEMILAHAREDEE